MHNIVVVKMFVYSISQSIWGSNDVLWWLFSGDSYQSLEYVYITYQKLQFHTSFLRHAKPFTRPWKKI